MPFVNAEQLAGALRRLAGTADHMLKIWFVLKQMGLRPGHRVEVTTSNPREALVRLFAFGEPDGSYFVPFAHTARFMTMMHDADRSIIQTNITRWAVSGSVVTLDPTDYLDCRQDETGTLTVGLGRHYPQGLGIGKDGFARAEDARVAIPDLAFAYWYFRQKEIPEDRAELFNDLDRKLFLSPAEKEVILVADPTEHRVTATVALTDAQVNAVVQQFRTAKSVEIAAPIQETFSQYSIRLQSMTTNLNLPEWLRADPTNVVDGLLKSGVKAMLLYGPPRTGKTRLIDAKFPRTSSDRITIQIHDGWGYDELILGFRPDKDGKWVWHAGPLLQAIRGGKKLIVLEEINRTRFTEAIGEVFSLIEESYRGKNNAIVLRDGTSFFIPEDVTIVATMNTLDRSTEELDDALFGRLAAVELPPRVEDLEVMLATAGVKDAMRAKFRELFAAVGRVYPLGHGYFSGVGKDTDPVVYYKTKIRPVLQSHLSGYRDNDLNVIDLKVDELFCR